MKVCPACGAEYGDDAAFCGRDRTPLAAAGGGMVGRLLADRYQIERKLGEGGMGQVYLARHVLLGRLSAIKVVSPSLTRDPDAIGRFNREATNASRITHPNVCAVYDFGLTDDGVLYLAMEYLEGRTLTAALAAGGLDVERATVIMEQCAAGLHAAHELGIVHRDLKPDNIMLIEQRGREVVKLVDFGIAKAGTGDGSRRVTQTGLVVGTPDYMSPEQLSSDEIDGRSDQYSLGLVYFRMLTGSMPFSAASVQELMARRLTESPRSLADCAPQRTFPPALQAALDRALARRPDDRFPTTEAFAAAVREAVGNPAQPVSLPRTVVVDRPRSRRWVTAGALVVTAAAAWGGWQLAGPDRGDDGAPTDPTPPPAAAVDTGTGEPPGAVELQAAGGTADPQPPVQAGATPTREPAGPALDLASLPTLEDIDPARPAAARAAVRRAAAAETTAVFPDSVRAEMGLLVGQYALDTDRKDEAAVAIRRACRRYPLRACGELLALFKDVP